ncbi:MAG: helix-turn-helix transcriptional regulator [candidate division WOR-3 bacterium]
MAELAELLKNLRPIRLRAGLTQAQVAQALGLIGKPGETVISRLELGKFQNPSLKLVLDFLRACRASPDDLASIFGTYLAQPLPVPRPKARGPRQTAEDKELLELRKEAAKWILLQVLEYMLHYELNLLKAPGGHPLRKAAVLFGRKVFRILLSTRGKDSSVQAKRLMRARASAGKQALPDDLTGYLEQRVRELFCDMEKEGELDWLPDIERAKRVMWRSPSRRIITDDRLCRDEFWQKQKAELEEHERLAGPIVEGAKRLLASAGITGNRLGNYLAFVNSFINIARTTKPDSTERTKRLEFLLATCTRKCHDPSLLRRLAEFVFEKWPG